MYSVEQANKLHEQFLQEREKADRQDNVLAEIYLAEISEQSMPNAISLGEKPSYASFYLNQKNAGFQLSPIDTNLFELIGQYGDNEYAQETLGKLQDQLNQIERDVLVQKWPVIRKLISQQLGERSSINSFVELLVNYASIAPVNVAPVIVPQVPVTNAPIPPTPTPSTPTPTPPTPPSTSTRPVTTRKKKLSGTALTRINRMKAAEEIEYRKNAAILQAKITRSMHNGNVVILNAYFDQIEVSSISGVRNNIKADELTSTYVQLLGFQQQHHLDPYNFTFSNTTDSSSDNNNNRNNNSRNNNSGSVSGKGFLKKKRKTHRIIHGRGANTIVTQNNTSKNNYRRLNKYVINDDLLKVGILECRLYSNGNKIVGDSYLKNNKMISSSIIDMIIDLTELEPVFSFSKFNALSSEDKTQFRKITDACHVYLNLETDKEKREQYEINMNEYKAGNKNAFITYLLNESKRDGSLTKKQVSEIISDLV